MQHNYHTHTKRCNHAVGEEREYIENAIANGIKVLGFSDHSPQIFSGDYYSYFRMKPRETEDYVKTLEALKNEYKNDIELHIGFEMEYYPSCFEKTLDFLSAYPYEYLILGQHALGDEEGDHYSSRRTSDKDILRRYVDQVIEGMRTGKFLYLAHPDLVNFVGDEEIYRLEMGRLCACAEELDIPLEINLLGIQRERNYPNTVFWRLVSEYDCRVVLGIDAHDPEDILHTENEQRGRELSRMCGLKITEKLELGGI